MLKDLTALEREMGDFQEQFECYVTFRHIEIFY